MTTWADAGAVNTSWGAKEGADGYVASGYMQSEYILGTDQWTVQASVSSVWTAA